MGELIIVKRLTLKKRYYLKYLTLDNFALKASSPACTELETIVMDWLGKMIGLPEEFLHSKPHSPGGGVIQVHHFNIL